jgi:hypothetical protein
VMAGPHTSISSRSSENQDFGWPGIADMQQLHSFLRSTHIARRLAEIVAIAAASLPTAGA